MKKVLFPGSFLPFAYANQSDLQTPRSPNWPRAFVGEGWSEPLKKRGLIWAQPILPSNVPRPSSMLSSLIPNSELPWSSWQVNHSISPLNIPLPPKKIWPYDQGLWKPIGFPLIRPARKTIISEGGPGCWGGLLVDQPWMKMPEPTEERRNQPRRRPSGPKQRLAKFWVKRPFCCGYCFYRWTWQCFAYSFFCGPLVPRKFVGKSWIANFSNDMAYRYRFKQGKIWVENPSLPSI